MKKSAKNRAEQMTLTLPGVAPKRGRPCKLDALSNAERQRKFRNSHNLVRSSEQMNSTISALATMFDITEAQVTAELLRFALCNRNWKQTGFPGCF